MKSLFHLSFSPPSFFPHGTLGFRLYNSLLFSNSLGKYILNYSNLLSIPLRYITPPPSPCLTPILLPRAPSRALRTLLPLNLPKSSLTSLPPPPLWSMSTCLACTPSLPTSSSRKSRPRPKLPASSARRRPTRRRRSASVIPPLQRLSRPTTGSSSNSLSCPTATPPVLSLPTSLPSSVWVRTSATRAGACTRRVSSTGRLLVSVPVSSLALLLPRALSDDTCTRARRVALRKMILALDASYSVKRLKTLTRKRYRCWNS